MSPPACSGIHTDTSWRSPLGPAALAGDTRLVLPAWPGAPPASPGTSRVAGWLGFSVDRPPRIEVELLPEQELAVPLGRVWVTARQREEKECTAISQRFLHQMKVAVRAAKQGCRVIPPLRLDGAGPDILWQQSMATRKASGRGIRREAKKGGQDSARQREYQQWQEPSARQARSAPAAGQARHGRPSRAPERWNHP